MPPHPVLPFALALTLVHCTAERGVEDTRTPGDALPTPSSGTPAPPGEPPAEPTPEPKECEPGQRVCAGDRPRRCSDQGRWQLEASCGGTQRCEAAACVAIDAPSCAEAGPGRTDCRAGDGGSCCDSRYVPAGRMVIEQRTELSSDGHSQSVYTEPDEDSPWIEVSAFRLDTFPVTVGRLRAFVDAVRAGYRPAPGSGRNLRAHDGRGRLGADGHSEPGWRAEWDDELGEWARDLAEQGGRSTCEGESLLHATPGELERKPANCVRGVAALAFCSWDGGFLPSWSEWQFAAAGGDARRLWPWGDEPPSLGRVQALGASEPLTALADVGAFESGRGRYGQYDLVGALSQFALDGSAPRPVRCIDCYVPGGGARPAMRLGGGVQSAQVPTSLEYWFVTGPAERHGLRCARQP